MKTYKIFNFLTGFGLLAMLGFTSCEKQEVIKVVGFVQGYVYDANSNEVLDNVTISWALPGGISDSTVATAVDGFNIDNLPSGTYILKCSKENYATSTIEVYIPKDDFAVTVKGGGTKEYVASVTPKLYSLDANITGRVYKYDNLEPYFGQTYSPLENVSVKLVYPYRPFIQDEYVTSTDADGFYTFENVPAGLGYVMTPDFSAGSQVHYIGAMNYAGSFSSGSTTTAPNVILIPIESWYNYNFQLIDGNLFDAPNVTTNKFPIDANISLIFSRILNQELTEYYYSIFGGIDLVLYDQSFTSIPFTFSFNGNLLTLNPDVDLNLDESYSIIGWVFADRLDDYARVNIQFRTAASK